MNIERIFQNTLTDILPLILSPLKLMTSKVTTRAETAVTLPIQEQLQEVSSLMESLFLDREIGMKI